MNIQDYVSGLREIAPDGTIGEWKFTTLLGSPPVGRDHHGEDVVKITTSRLGPPLVGRDHHAVPRLEIDSDKRKEYPLYSGLVRYFPAALYEIARLSRAATEKHHPGQPMHWDRSKSGDELDALCRHLAEAGTRDTDGFFHDVKIAWRALANLQKLLEREEGLPISPASKP